MLTKLFYIGIVAYIGNAITKEIKMNINRNRNFKGQSLIKRTSIIDIEGIWYIMIDIPNSKSRINYKKVDFNKIVWC